MNHETNVIGPIGSQLKTQITRHKDLQSCASSLIQRLLFLERFANLTETLVTIRKLNLRCRDLPSNLMNTSQNIESFGTHLVQLLRSQPMESYLDMAFQQFISFLFEEAEGTSRELLLRLLSFINEVREIFGTMSLEDKTIFKKCFPSATGDKQSHRFQENAMILVCWSVSEAAKYFVCRKLSPNKSPIDFLGTVIDTVASPISAGDEARRRILIEFINHLDSLIHNWISESSSGTHTFKEHRVEKFFHDNRSKFKLWFIKNSQRLARASLNVGDPANCWRHINTRLTTDFKTKFNYSKMEVDEPSFAEILHSLSSNNWQSNLILISSSARLLGDVDLLHGIDSLSRLQELPCDNPTLQSMIHNIEGRHETTYNSFLNSRNNDVDERNKIEFLNSCIHLGLLEENSSHIGSLRSHKLRSIFDVYLDSVSSESTEPNYRLRKLKNWLGSWSELNDPNDLDCTIFPNKEEVIISSCLNVIARTPVEQSQDLFSSLYDLFDNRIIVGSLNQPSLWNGNLTIYCLLTEMLKTRDFSPGLLKNQPIDDLNWCQSFYRLTSEFNLVNNLRSRHQEIDLIQLNAFKYHKKKRNLLLASKIAKNLVDNTSSTVIKFLTTIPMIDENSPEPQRCHLLLEEAKNIKNATDLGDTTRSELIQKILRKFLRVPVDFEANKCHLHRIVSQHHDEPIDIMTSGLERINLTHCWQSFMAPADLVCRTKTMLAFSRYSNKKLELHPGDEDLINSTFELDVKLLVLLVQSESAKYKSSAIECALRLLKQVYNHHNQLNSGALLEFNSAHFIDTTWIIWFHLRLNLVATISCTKRPVSYSWRESLITMVKRIAEARPNSFIYDIIVNELDLKYEIFRLTSDSRRYKLEPGSMLFRDFNDLSSKSTNNILKIEDKLANCRRGLQFWQELSEHIKMNYFVEHGDNWTARVQQTEKFIKEIRKIGHLCGEYLRRLVMHIPRKLRNCLDSCRRIICKSSNKSIPDEMISKLATICSQAMEGIQALLNYEREVKLQSRETKYENWFFDTFSKIIGEIESSLVTLDGIKRLNIDQLESCLEAVSSRFETCGDLLNHYSQSNRNMLFMELLSPVLSRMDPSQIPMPGCHQAELETSTAGQVTIHRVSQPIHVMTSRTGPKKLKLIGSDGISRFFLLKSGEDLRLDQTLMNVFSIVNTLLSGDKQADNSLQVRLFSVTPMSSSSGLIQWVEASSFNSFYRAWLRGPNGKRAIEDVYSSTCSILCPQDAGNSQSILEVDRSLKPSHTLCQPPVSFAGTCDMFYQLLWAKIKLLSTDNSNPKAKPSQGNIAKYRAKLDPSFFESTIVDICERIPSELISNQLLYKSINSHAYWLKTNQFIRSCATMSMVGHIIGLGDRHPDNILLNTETGQVVHIDFNICFGLGKALCIPEKVPFRLTRNMIQAFGFAGLEGGFTRSCCKVLGTMKRSRETMTNLLDPVNFDFLIDTSISRDIFEPSSHLSLNLKQQINLAVFDQQSDVKDQVDALIREATSIKNQSAMFEGWSPWM